MPAIVPEANEGDEPVRPRSCGQNGLLCLIRVILPCKSSGKPESCRLTAKIRRGFEMSISVILVAEWRRIEVEASRIVIKHVIDFDRPTFKVWTLLGESCRGVHGSGKYSALAEGSLCPEIQGDCSALSGPTCCKSKTKSQEMAAISSQLKLAADRMYIQTKRRANLNVGSRLVGAFDFLPLFWHALW